ncbi:uncharacterized protein LOC129974623 [Argiope bruennichi]|uniref:uncharacterized protein LOC129974623 n=1 Tax=Argiope bruennichi TaxID=94029 RepID=UPI0024940980|nr:uncharacterized protein LOC129974623 [Argiope bruennichi]
MVNARLLYELEKNGYISPFQSGFRRGRSTSDNLIRLESQIRNAFDIEKAYDRTWRYGILRALGDFGFKGNLPVFIQNFLKFRTFRVRIGNTFSHHFIQNEGVPQGSVLSVTLFILHISKILHVLPSSVCGTLYVDDLQISCQGSNMNLIERQLQRAVNKLISWCDENGHTLSPEKSRCVHFCRKRSLHPDPVIQIRGVDIPVVEESSQLPDGGADRTSLLRIYQSVILSRIDYGCEIYGTARSSVLRNLDTVYNSALRICSGAFRTSPVHSLYVICHQLPLHLRRKKLSELYFFRIESFINHPIRRVNLPIGLGRLYNARPSNILPFRERITRTFADPGILNLQVHNTTAYALPPWDIPEISYLNPFLAYDKSATSSVVFQQLFLYHRNEYSTHIPVFTDGSKTAYQVGCAVVIAEDASSFHMSALEALSHPHTKTHPVAVDILHLWRNLQARNYQILFCWLPGHVGIVGNESADAAAKTASTSLQRAIPYTDFKKYISQRIFCLWKESWDLQISNKLHSLQSDITLWPVVPIRELDVKLTRLRIGHTRLTHKHLLFAFLFSTVRSGEVALCEKPSPPSLILAS